MKRLSIIIVISLLFASVFVSCKSSEHCPAYGSSEQQPAAQKL